MSGKGSKRRPTFVPMHEFGDNWAKIFEKPKQKEEENVNSRSTKNENERSSSEQADSPTDTNGRDAL
jgi:hypothetical protein